MSASMGSGGGAPLLAEKVSSVYNSQNSGKLLQVLPYIDDSVLRFGNRQGCSPAVTIAENVDVARRCFRSSSPSGLRATT